MTDKELKVISETFKNNLMELMMLIKCSSHFDVTCYNEGWIILTLYNDLPDNRYMRQMIEYKDGDVRFKTTIQTREV